MTARTTTQTTTDTAEVVSTLRDLIVYLDECEMILKQVPVRNRHDIALHQGIAKGLKRAREGVNLRLYEETEPQFTR